MDGHKKALATVLYLLDRSYYYYYIVAVVALTCGASSSNATNLPTINQPRPTLSQSKYRIRRLRSVVYDIFLSTESSIRLPVDRPFTPVSSLSLKVVNGDGGGRTQICSYLIDMVASPYGGPC